MRKKLIGFIILKVIILTLCGLGGWWYYAKYIQKTADLLILPKISVQV
jgi:hypothetical protein